MGVEENSGPVDVQQLAIDMLQDKSTVDDNPAEVLDTTTSGEPSEVEDSEPSEDQLIVGGHPAWQEILTAVPEQYHEALIPKLKGWDSGVTQRFQEIHSQYKPYKDFEPIVEQGFDPDSLSQAVGLYQALTKDPESVYRSLGEAYGFIGEQESESDDEDEDYQIPRALQEQLNRQEQAIEIMAEQLQNQTLQEQQGAQQEELDNYLEGLREEYGEFDEDYVLTKIANGTDGEVAVRQFLDLVGVVPADIPRAQAPKVFGSSGVGSGGVPTNNPEISTMSDQDTRALVAEALRVAAEQ